MLSKSQTPVGATVLEFMKRLRECEQTGDSKKLASLFNENAECMNLTRQNTLSGHDHGRECPPEKFWSQYVHAFDRVESHFTNVIDDGKTAVLEWQSIGSLPMGLPLDYCGVSILEYDDAGIKAFRTYYDSAAFMPHAARSDKTHAQSVGLPDMEPTPSS